MSIMLPLEKSSVLLDEINSYISSKELDEGRLRAIQDEIEVIQQAGHFYEAKQLLGMVAALRGDVESAKRSFQAAKSASGGHPVVVSNFAQALGNLHMYEDAIVEMQQALIKCPDDLNILSLALKIFVDSYHIEEAFEVKKKIELLDAHNLIRDDLESELITKKELMSLAGATPEMVTSRIGLASKVIRDNKVRYLNVLESVCGDCMLFEYELTVDQTASALIEDKIHSAISSQAYSPADSFIAFSCMPS